MRVIRMIMSEKNSIDPVYSRGDKLESQLWRRIDEQPDSIVRLDDSSHPIALVARIG